MLKTPEDEKARAGAEKKPAAPAQSSKIRTIQGLMLVASVALALLAPRFINVMAVAENWASDLRVSFFNPPAEKHPGIIILAITEETLSKLPYRSPVDRAFLAKVLNTLKQAKVKAVGLDILFDQKTEKTKDEMLQEALRSAPFPVVVGWTDIATGLTEAQYEFQQTYLEGIDAGYSNLFKDPVDGTVRNLFVGRMDGGNYRLGFMVKMADLLGHKPPSESIRLVYRGTFDASAPAFPKFPIDAVHFLPKKWFEGKVVLIGADLPFKDRHRTPFAVGKGIAVGSLPGVEIQAHILSQIMDGRLDKGSNAVYEGIVAFILCLSALALTFSDYSLRVKFLAAGSLLTAFWGGTIGLFLEWGFMAPLVSPTLAFGGAMGLGSAYSARLQKEKTLLIRGAFSQYLSPAMVEILAENPEHLKLGGEQKDLTLLFCDVRGFTTISEQFDAVGLTKLINKLLTPLTNVILARQGTVDKYMGDCIMAFWNAPLDDEDHARNGCLSALEMLAEIAPLNERLEAEAMDEGRKHIPLRVGLGLNSGPVVVGNMGSDQRFDYSALGDAVNLAARLEGQSKNYGVDIVIGQTTREQAPELATIELDFIQVKGKSEGVHVYALMGDENVAAREDFQALKSATEDMIATYRSQDWGGARKKLETCRARVNGFRISGLYDLYAERIYEYHFHPPPADWQGLYVAETK